MVCYCNNNYFHSYKYLKINAHLNIGTFERMFKCLHIRLSLDSDIGWGDSREVIQTWDGATPGESFRPGMGRLHGSHSDLGWGDSREVIQT